MAKIVLVHGIGQQLREAADLEREWLGSLVTGLRLAGWAETAESLEGPGAARARMAFYGKLFLEPDQQGDDPGPLSEPQAELAERLAREWLRRARDRSPGRDSDTARRELAYVEGAVGDEEQGPRQVARWAVKGLGKLRWFAPRGMALAEEFVNRALAQVTRYFTDAAIRKAAKATVRRLIDDETRVVIAHSLGSVVAYEAAFELERRLPLLVTIGSPLGLETIVYDRLLPQPPGFPPVVERWINVADRDDFIAAEPDLRKMFAAGVPAGARFDGCRTVDNGAQPHDAAFYLRQREVVAPVGEALAG